MSDLSEFHEDLLVEIARRIKLYDDFVSFRSVCSSWRLVANIKNFMYKSDQMPLLMLPCQKGADERGFFNLSKAITRRVCLPEAKDKNCFSSKGWLLTIDCRDLVVSLLNPFSHARIELPNPLVFGNLRYDLPFFGGPFFFHKFVLSSTNLLESDYIVMVIHGIARNLVYIRSGQKSWTTIDTRDEFNSDVIYYKDKFYAINYNGRILVCDLSGENTNPIVAQEATVMPNHLREKRWGKFYLVESDGALLVVGREGVALTYHGINVTYRFQVFKVDLVTNAWMDVKDIGNRALFLGHNSSLSIQVLDSSICKPNCIYFTDDCEESYVLGKDMGIYNIKDGSVIPHFTSKTRIRNILAPPMWVEQTFN